MSTERRTDHGDYVLVETGEPTIEDPTEWVSVRAEWKPGTTPAVERTLTDRADAALVDLRLVVSSTGTLTAAQLSNAVRVMARVLVVLVRLQLRRLDSTD